LLSLDPTDPLRAEEAMGRPEGRQRRLRCRVGRLGVGDYLVGARVVVERKTLDDFAASVIDARVFDQANRRARSTLAGVLLLEGRKLRRRVGRGQLQGAWITLTIVFSLHVLRSVDADETRRSHGRPRGGDPPVRPEVHDDLDELPRAVLDEEQAHLLGRRAPALQE
jgi:hypothetical protein